MTGRATATAAYPALRLFIDGRWIERDGRATSAIVTPFETPDQAIAEANRLNFGLASYAFTNDLRLADRLAREIEAGSLAINHWAASFPETPFGGVKESGFGTDTPGWA